MYDLDDSADEDAIDVTPDFMKHEEPELDAAPNAPEAPEAPDAPDAPETDDKE